LGVGIYFFFQSGACFLVICYILKQKPLLSWILVLKFVICTVYRSFPSFTQFFHCFTWLIQNVDQVLHSVHWVFHGFNWFSMISIDYMHLVNM
jgi:hypothetical protein